MSDTQRDREERQHVIEVLKSWDGYFIGYTSDEVQEALRYAISSIETDLRYDLLYEETSGQADKPTTKNNLGVDWESYKDVDGNCLDDLILEVLQNNFDCGNTYGYKVADEIIGLLPSVTPQEPKTGHYEKHIDHTDCIWYGSDSGCPVTCSQYRDGWNDAMDYIFMNGKGYQPYRHDV